MSSLYGYWIDPYGGITEAPISHIKSILDNPAEFGLSKDQLVPIFKKYGEKIGWEGKARDEIMTDLLKEGWLRARFIPSSWAWVVQIWELDSKQRNALWDFARFLFEKKNAPKNTGFTIVELNRNNETTRTTIAKIISGELLEILQKRLNERSKNGRIKLGELMDSIRLIKKNSIAASFFPKQAVNEATLNRILSTHFDNGFIIITSYKYQNEPEINNKNFRELKSLIKNKHSFSYFPVWGGYVEKKGTPEEKHYFEPSIFITNYKIASSKAYETTENLKKLVIELAKKYDQETFLYKPSVKEDTEKAYLVDQRGNIKTELNEKTINDLTQEFYTSLFKQNPNFQKKDKKLIRTPKQFTLLFNPNPSGIAEACLRYGETFFNLYNMTD